MVRILTFIKMHTHICEHTWKKFLKIYLYIYATRSVIAF